MFLQDIFASFFEGSTLTMHGIMSDRKNDVDIGGSVPPMMPTPIDADTDTISLAFLISLSVTFAVIMILLILVAAYVTFCGSDEDDFDEELGFGPNGSGNSNNRRRSPLGSFFKKKQSDVLLDASFADTEDNTNDAEFLVREKEELKKFSPFEIELYYRAKEFQKINPPSITKFGTYVNDTDLVYLKDRGIQSYFLLPSINDNVDESGHFLPSFLIQDKIDISFTQFNKSSSTVLNYPLPYNKRESVYFEVKVFKHLRDSNSVFSIGLTTVPYPYFRIPGTCKFSIAYESTGKLRINNPLYANTLLPKLVEGDIVGFGYKYRTGTIYITHNGKKLMDVTQNIHIDLFVSIGAFNASYTRSYTMDGLLEDADNISLRNTLSQGQELELPLKLQKVYDIHNEEVESDPVELNINLGQLGFVFIEANVKKYAFGTVFGEIGVPPAYNGKEIKRDIILQKGEDLPPKYTDNSMGGVIVGNSSNRHVRNHQQQGSQNLDLDGEQKMKKELPTFLDSVDRYERSSSRYDQRYNHDTFSDENNVFENTLASSPCGRVHNASSSSTYVSDEETPLLFMASHGAKNNIPRQQRMNKKNKNRKNKKKKKRARV